MPPTFAAACVSSINGVGKDVCVKVPLDQDSGSPVKSSEVCVCFCCFVLVSCSHRWFLQAVERGMLRKRTFEEVCTDRFISKKRCVEEAILHMKLMDQYSEVTMAMLKRLESYAVEIPVDRRVDFKAKILSDRQNHLYSMHRAAEAHMLMYDVRLSLASVFSQAESIGLPELKVVKTPVDDEALVKLYEDVGALVIKYCVKALCGHVIQIEFAPQCLVFRERRLRLEHGYYFGTAPCVTFVRDVFVPALNEYNKAQSLASSGI
jgi:hypothetical protein